MSDVMLEVGGRKYSVACQDGQEAHIQRLATMVDARLGSMGANLSTQEAKNLLFAALLLADELEEHRQQQPPPPPAEPDFDAERLAAQLERFALALENAAQVLERGPAHA